MSFTSHVPTDTYVRPPRVPRRVRDAVCDPMVARREAVEIASAAKPLARVAALLLSISRNNCYEGRDPNVIPDSLTCGFIADFLGVEISSLAALLMELRRQGIIELTPQSALRLRNSDALELISRM